MKNRRVTGVAQAVREYFSVFDKGLFFVALSLAAIGLFAVNTATSGAERTRSVIVQLIAIGIGLVGVFVLSKINYTFLAQLSVPIVCLSFALLLFTAMFAQKISGNSNWIRIGAFSFQPSELTKVAFILTFSSHVAQVRDSLNRPKTLLFLCIHFAAYLLPILMQGDFGSALIYCAMFAVILYLAGLQYRYFIIAGVLLVASVPILWNFVLKDYHKKRILFSLDPELDPKNFGYQPLLSRIAIGSGKLTGMGYGDGIQSQNELLPASRTDFIYSVIGEEFGFIGCVAVLLLSAVLVILLIRAARRARDDMGMFLCCGAAAMFAAQFLINIGMCIGVSPVIGITLPFISAGGSSVMSSFFAVGLAESVRMKPDLSLRFGDRRRGRR